MIRYPNGQKYIPTGTNKSHKTNDEISLSSANRGMNLENDINISNEYYKNAGICVVTKRPTPINVVKVDYSNGPRIIDAYFEKQSTTDYNGVYKGRYLDFEAKSTKSKTSFPLSNISSHQIQHLKQVLACGGIAFFIIEFESKKEVYFLEASYVINAYEKSLRKSIPYEQIKSEGTQLKLSYSPRIDYIAAINEKIFKK